MKNNQKSAPTTNIVINTNRLWYGKDSTVSAFIATAYDKDGNNVAAAMVEEPKHLGKGPRDDFNKIHLSFLHIPS